MYETIVNVQMVIQFSIFLNLMLDVGFLRFTASVALPTGKIAGYQLNRKLGGPTNWSGRFEEKNSLPLEENKV